MHPQKRFAESLGLHQDNGASAIDPAHQSADRTKHLLIFHCARRAEAFRPEILNPEDNRGFFQPRHQPRRNAYRHRRSLKDEDRVIRLATASHTGDASRQRKGQVVQNKPYTLAVATGYQRRSDDFRGLEVLGIRAAPTIAGRQSALRIIRQTGQNSDRVAALDQALDKVVYPEALWPEMLGYHKDMHVQDNSVQIRPRKPVGPTVSFRSGGNLRKRPTARAIERGERGSNVSTGSTRSRT